MTLFGTVLGARNAIAAENPELPLTDTRILEMLGMESTFSGKNGCSRMMRVAARRRWPAGESRGTAGFDMGPRGASAARRGIRTKG